MLRDYGRTEKPRPQHQRLMSATHKAQGGGASEVYIQISKEQAKALAKQVNAGIQGDEVTLRLRAPQKYQNQF
jgi:hypothetical protein